MKGEWSAEDGGFWGGGREAIVRTHSPCFPLTALELTIQLFAEYIECHAILMTPSMRTFPDSLLISPPVFI